MTKVVAEHSFNGLTQSYDDAYNPRATTLGKWIRQDEEGYAGPLSPATLRFYEGGTISPNFPCNHPSAIDVGNNTHWVFFLENTSTNNVQKCVLSVHNTLTNEWRIKGWLTLNWPTAATAQTTRAFQAFRYLHSDGNVSANANSTSLTGNNTTWSTSRIAAGARIGFGSTDPAEIKVWYEISAIGSDTSITLTKATVNAIPPNTPYVIEEIRLYTGRASGATVGGLTVAKGINFEDFKFDGTISIASATTTDNIKACYWLADAATVLNTNASGVGLSETWTNTSHMCYVMDVSATVHRIYKYDVRASLTGLSSGKSTTAFLYRTNSQTYLTTVTDRNYWGLIKTRSGPLKDQEMLVGGYTTAFAVSAFPTNVVVDGATLFASHFMRSLELPFGSNSFFVTSNTMSGMGYMPTMDKMFLSGTNSMMATTSYRTNGVSDDARLGAEIRISAKKSSIEHQPPHPRFAAAAALTVNCCNDFVYSVPYLGIGPTGINLATYCAYAIPVGFDADDKWIDSKNRNRLISAEIPTPLCRKFYHVGVQHSCVEGTVENGLQTVQFTLYYRTAGIADDSGAWNLVPANGNLGGIGPASSIQFMFEFHAFSDIMIQPRIFGLSCSYEREGTDIHFQPSVNLTNKSTKTFVWRFGTAFSSILVPTLTVKIYEATTDTLLIKDTTIAGTYGTWQKSTDGGYTWTAYNTNNKTNEKTYIRYVPTALADNLRVKAVLTQ